MACFKLTWKWFYRFAGIQDSHDHSQALDYQHIVSSRCYLDYTQKNAWNEIFSSYEQNFQPEVLPT